MLVGSEYSNRELPFVHGGAGAYTKASFMLFTKAPRGVVDFSLFVVTKVRRAWHIESVSDLHLGEGVSREGNGLCPSHDFERLNVRC
jgi:hypothetical protein